VALLGGREIHPINVKVGGFYRVPTRRELAPLAEKLKWARDAAVETVKFTAGLPFMEFEQDYEFIALRHTSEYPMNEGKLVSNRGLDIGIRDYEFYFEESHVQHSNALHSTMKQKGAYFVGPLARFNLNFDRLSEIAQSAAKDVGFVPEIRNPFKGIVVRAIEVVYACEEALRIVESYEEPTAAAVEVVPRAGFGFGCTEAPRGILYHRYRIGDDGLIKDAKIVPPTAQNLGTIENDLRGFVAANIDMPKDWLTLRCEQAVRNYDPCISCATHFLKLDIEGS